MRPTGDLREQRGRAGFGIGLVEAAKAGIAVGMEMAAAALQQGAGVLGLTIGRVAIEGRRRRCRSIGPFIAHRCP